jgi:hypothetical protein
MLKGPTQDEGLGRIWFYPFLFCKEVDKLEKVSSLPLRHAYPPLGDREVFGKKNNHIMSCRILHPYSKKLKCCDMQLHMFLRVFLVQRWLYKDFFLNLIASKQVVK